MTETTTPEVSEAVLILRKCRIVESADCPRDELEKYLKDTTGVYPRVIRKSAWSNPTLTREQYEYGVACFTDYYRHNYYQHHYDIAEGLQVNKGMPGDLIVMVPDVTFRILHPNCPRIELVRIATEEAYHTKRRLALKRDLPEDIQFLMSRDTDAKVRSSLAKNNALTAAVIKDWYPRETRLPILRSLALRKNAKPFKEDIVSHLNTLVERKGTSTAWTNRVFNARHSADTDTLEDMATASDGLLAEIALRNKNIAEDTLAKVAISHPSGRMRKRAALKKNCPDEGKVAQALRACTCGHWNCTECNMRGYDAQR